ncbi:sulfite exporter TauE/SafE family protein [Gammaproteobacteria bacterium]|nr:sulfite exporter TauE/SafE family protein [Gammaproteobacteria bacterium]
MYLLVVIVRQSLYIQFQALPTVLQLDPVFFILSCLSLGLFSGLLGGMLGIGGGVIIVPALYLLYGSSDRFESPIMPVVAIATSLTCIIFTSASAAFAQYRRAMVLWDPAIKLLPALLIGSLLASFIIPSLPPALIKSAVAIFLALVAVVMATSWQPSPQLKFPGYLGASAVGLGAGFISGSAGIAGGNVIVPTLIFFNTPAHNATATSSFLGIPIALAGSLGYFWFAPEIINPELIGYVDQKAFICIVIGSVIAAPVGVKIAHSVSPALLKRVFGILLAAVSTKMIVDVLGLSN